MSKLAKMMDVLDLFTPETPLISVEEMADRLAISRPTAFRYVKELSSVGFLGKLGTRYALGARVIELEYQFRQSSPILNASAEVMRELAQATASGVFLAHLLGTTVFNLQIEPPEAASLVTFGRGRPLPILRGAASKVILAHLPTTRLKTIFEQHSDDIDHIATDFEQFARYFRHIKKRGYYVSKEEVNQGVVGIAAPIFGDRRAILGSLVLVFEERRQKWMDEAGCAELVMSAAREITARISSAADEVISAPG
ncbi:MULTISPECIES: IclR family transcriptional regulator [Paraburkholderia]|uniref:IclR family transcriptional regulator n=1 Tax=Paraburkholderia TaxID=1822464 RepID=UPI002AB7CAD8|nr:MULTISPECIES: IclR family transcriptional regulator [Paraburkholderia]